MQKIEVDTVRREFSFDGVKCSFDVLDFIFNPRPDRKFRFERRDDLVIIRGEDVPLQ